MSSTDDPMRHLSWPRKLLSAPERSTERMRMGVMGVMGVMGLMREWSFSRVLCWAAFPHQESQRDGLLVPSSERM